MVKLHNQRFLKVKIGLLQGIILITSWIICSWKQITVHFPSFNSSSDPRVVILSRWVPRSITYKEYISYDHYIIMEQNEIKDNSTKDLVSSCISSHKEKLTMMPRSHFEERFTYYDSVWKSSFTAKDYQTYYFGKERENKRKIYFETLKIHHKHLYVLKTWNYFNTMMNIFSWTDR